jgi:hypothetical protein
MSVDDLPYESPCDELLENILAWGLTRHMIMRVPHQPKESFWRRTIRSEVATIWFLCYSSARFENRKGRMFVCRQCLGKDW